MTNLKRKRKNNEKYNNPQAKEKTKKYRYFKDKRFTLAVYPCIWDLGLRTLDLWTLWSLELKMSGLWLLTYTIDYVVNPLSIAYDHTTMNTPVLV